jgi:hypothetical protein
VRAVVGPCAACRAGQIELDHAALSSAGAAAARLPVGTRSRAERNFKTQLSRRRERVIAGSGGAAEPRAASPPPRCGQPSLGVWALSCCERRSCLGGEASRCWRTASARHTAGCRVAFSVPPIPARGARRIGLVFRDDKLSDRMDSDQKWRQR